MLPSVGQPPNLNLDFLFSVPLPNLQSLGAQHLFFPQLSNVGLNLTPSQVSTVTAFSVQSAGSTFADLVASLDEDVEFSPTQADRFAELQAIEGV